MESNFEMQDLQQIAKDGQKIIGQMQAEILLFKQEFPLLASQSEDFLGGHIFQINLLIQQYSTRIRASSQPHEAIKDFSNFTILKCPNMLCQHDNQIGIGSCAQCGTSLKLPCPHCHKENFFNVQECQYSYPAHNISLAHKIAYSAYYTALTCCKTDQYSLALSYLEELPDESKNYPIVIESKQKIADLMHKYIETQKQEFAKESQEHYKDIVRFIYEQKEKIIQSQQKEPDKKSQNDVKNIQNLVAQERYVEAFKRIQELEKNLVWNKDLQILKLQVCRALCSESLKKADILLRKKQYLAAQEELKKVSPEIALGVDAKLQEINRKLSFPPKSLMDITIIALKRILVLLMSASIFLPLVAVVPLIPIIKSCETDRQSEYREYTGIEIILGGSAGIVQKIDPQKAEKEFSNLFNFTGNDMNLGSQGDVPQDIVRQKPEEQNTFPSNPFFLFPFLCLIWLVAKKYHSSRDIKSLEIVFIKTLDWFILTISYAIYVFIILRLPGWEVREFLIGAQIIEGGYAGLILLHFWEIFQAGNKTFFFEKNFSGFLRKILWGIVYFLMTLLLLLACLFAIDLSLVRWFGFAIIVLTNTLAFIYTIIKILPKFCNILKTKEKTSYTFKGLKISLVINTLFLATPFSFMIAAIITIGHYGDTIIDLILHSIIILSIIVWMIIICMPPIMAFILILYGTILGEPWTKKSSWKLVIVIVTIFLLLVFSASPINIW